MFIKKTLEIVWEQSDLTLQERKTETKKVADRFNSVSISPQI